METKRNRLTMPDHVKEKALAFISGDAAVMYLTFIKIPDEVLSLWWKVVVTIIVGIAGGVAGMIGKDLYVYIKSLILKRKP
jgi:hypothetical protein